MRLPAGGDRGRPVLRDTRLAMVEFSQALCPARPQDEAERWPASVADSFPTRFGARAWVGVRKVRTGREPTTRYPTTACRAKLS